MSAGPSFHSPDRLNRAFATGDKKGSGVNRTLLRLFCGGDGMGGVALPAFTKLLGVFSRSRRSLGRCGRCGRSSRNTVRSTIGRAIRSTVGAIGRIAITVRRITIAIGIAVAIAVAADIGAGIHVHGEVAITETVSVERSAPAPEGLCIVGGESGNTHTQGAGKSNCFDHLVHVSIS